MRKITIVSGKGGVGKSMLTSSLAVLLAKQHKIIAVDCDVDAPNLGLSLGLEDSDYHSWYGVTTNEKAELIADKCTGCGKCTDVCAFGAVRWNEKIQKPVFDSLFCEGCGACLLVCNENAIRLKKVKNARIGIGKTKHGFAIVTGQLKMGESGSGKVVFMVKNKAEEIGKKEKSALMLIDAAAGIGCPVIASVQGSEYVIAVTEPTPSALDDVKRVLSVVQHFGIACGLVINKFDLNRKFSKKIEAFAKSNNIQLLGRIPYDRKFVDAVVNLKPVVVYDKRFVGIFKGILDRLDIDSFRG